MNENNTKDPRITKQSSDKPPNYRAKKKRKNTHPVSEEDFSALSDGHVYRLPVMPLFTRQAQIAARRDLFPPVQVLSFRVLLQRVLELLEPLRPSVRHHV